ncbi:hypothetical protein [Chromobacterium subtsugae]|uniref:hypothetical protein n=1 Tax=Chromobacterium subtsugae TaxID=251747 RepID=UPI00128D322E|nr:hypothetical protein [Chromobacterium subtsugae]
MAVACRNADGHFYLDRREMESKKLVCGVMALVIAASSMSGCSSAKKPRKNKYLAQASSAAAIKNIDIYYHKADYGVMDLDGSSGLQVGGLFGAVGLLASLGAEAASRATAKDRSVARSEEFSKLMNSLDGDNDIDLAQAKKLADMLTASGRTVRLVEIKRPQAERLLLDQTPNLPDSDENAVLVLRTTLGYGAESATASYKSIVVTEYVLQKINGEVVHRGKQTIHDDGQTYMTFSGLKEAYVETHQALGKDAQTIADRIFAAVVK